MLRADRRTALLKGLLPFATAVALGLAPLALASAQDWPTKPVRIMVGASAGGGTDLIARMLAEKYQAIFGQPFIVDNRPGASNTIAADLTAQAEPDGHTLLVATTTGQAIAPHLLKLRFDPLTDLAPVALVLTVPNVLVVNNDVPAKSVEELVSLIKSEPGQVLLRLLGRGQHPAHGRRGLRQCAGPDARARALQGLGPGADRSGRRPDPDDVRHHLLRDRPDHQPARSARWP